MPDKSVRRAGPGTWRGRTVCCARKMRAYSESNRGEYSRPVAKEAAVGPRAFARQPLRPFPPGRLRARVFSPPVAALLSSAAVSELRHTPSLTTEQPGNGSGGRVHFKQGQTLNTSACSVPSLSPCCATRRTQQKQTLCHVHALGGGKRAPLQQRRQSHFCTCRRTACPYGAHF